jgi:hypothetical protein
MDKAIRKLRTATSMLETLFHDKIIDYYYSTDKDGNVHPNTHIQCEIGTPEDWRNFIKNTYNKINEAYNSDNPDGNKIRLLNNIALDINYKLEMILHCCNNTNAKICKDVKDIKHTLFDEKLFDEKRLYNKH